MNMNIKKIGLFLSLLFVIGCGGTMLDDTSLETSKIQIQGVSVTSASSTASIIWTTDVPSTHKIMYGTVSGSYTQSTTESTTGSTTHQVDLSSLATNQVYYYKMVCNAGGYEPIESAEYTFNTSSSISITLLTAVSITTTSADITWTTGVATTHIVEYGTVAGNPDHSTIQSSVASTSHTVSLTGLTPGATYYYRVKNFHAALPFTTSTELSFTTNTIIVSGITETPTETSLTISWTTNVASTHSIDYGTATGTYSSSTTPAGPTLNHTVTITGLTEGRLYYYRINNTAAIGAVVSNERSVSTTSVIAVSAISAGSLTTTSATISWTTVLPTTDLIEYGTVSGSYIYTTGKSTSETPAHSVVLTGLIPGQQYYYRVINFHATLPYIVSAEQSFTTTGVITVSGITDASNTTSITISWTSSPATTHRINYGTVSGSLSSNTATTSSVVTNHTETITGLEIGKTYYYKIINIDSTLGTVTSAERTYYTTPTPTQKLNGIWLVGGLSGSGATALIAHSSVVSSLDLYDPETNTWYQNVASAATGTYVPVSFAGVESFKVSASDHRIYVFGGFDASGNTRNLVQYYSIEGNSWATDTLNPVPQYRANINAVRIQNKIYVMGGTGSAAATTVATIWAGSTTNYEYTPTLASGAWSSKAVLGAGVSERFMLPFNDIIYNMCGRNAATTVAALAHDGFVYYANAVTSGTEVVMTTAPSVDRTGVTGAMYVPPSGPAIMILMGGFTGTLTGATGYSVLQGTAGSVGTSVVQSLAFPFIFPSIWYAAATPYPLSVGFGSAVVYYSSILSPNYRFYYFGGTQSLVSAAAVGLTAVKWSPLPLAPPTVWTSSWTDAAVMLTGRYGHTALMIQQ